MSHMPKMILLDESEYIAFNASPKPWLKEFQIMGVVREDGIIVLSSDKVHAPKGLISFEAFMDFVKNGLPKH